MTSPDHDESKPRRRWPTYLAVVLVLVLVLVLVVYPLSVGPAMVIAARLSPQDASAHIKTLYHPVFVACEATNTNPLIIAYMTWWLRIATW